MTPSKVWLIVAAVCLIIEILPPPTHFFFLCMSLGAVAASIAVLLTSITWVPWVVFAVTTVALTPMLIPLAKFLFKTSSTASNVDELINEKAQVMEDIALHKTGSVKFRGEVWRAMSEGESIPKDAWVQILRVDGTRVVVRRIP